jgi:hypothetical protein
MAVKPCFLSLLVIFVYSEIHPHGKGASHIAGETTVLNTNLVMQALERWLVSLARKIPLSSNAITILGLLAMTAAAGFMLRKQPAPAGIFIILSGLLDILDVDALQSVVGRIVVHESRQVINGGHALHGLVKRVRPGDVSYMDFRRGLLDLSTEDPDPFPGLDQASDEFTPDEARAARDKNHGRSLYSISRHANTPKAIHGINPPHIRIAPSSVRSPIPISPEPDRAP